jgi:hypothetical protein
MRPAPSQAGGLIDLFDVIGRSSGVLVSAPDAASMRIRRPRPVAAPIVSTAPM